MEKKRKEKKEKKIPESMEVKRQRLCDLLLDIYIYRHRGRIDIDTDIDNRIPGISVHEDLLQLEEMQCGQRAQRNRRNSYCPCWRYPSLHTRHL
tara:strand:+ start:867 stop:1148 length:282 start_codon:yes stop_codon:yes gene_type:complete